MEKMMDFWSRHIEQRCVIGVALYYRVLGVGVQGRTWRRLMADRGVTLLTQVCGCVGGGWHRGSRCYISHCLSPQVHLLRLPEKSASTTAPKLSCCAKN